VSERSAARTEEAGTSSSAQRRWARGELSGARLGKTRTEEADTSVWSRGTHRGDGREHPPRRTWHRLPIIFSAIYFSSSALLWVGKPSPKNKKITEPPPPLATTTTPALLLHRGKARRPGPLSEAPHPAALLRVQSGPCMRRHSAAGQRLGFAAPSSGAAVFLSRSVRDSSTTAPNRFGVSSFSLHRSSESIWGESVLPPPDSDFHPQSNSEASRVS
jgi:hypothetical protein